MLLRMPYADFAFALFNIHCHTIGIQVAALVLLVIAFDNVARGP